ncbi:peroxisomal membrane protein pex14 [Candidozyma auris]|uniref:Peroxisomal membrane protein PEX14 n=2 Tax=Candidozyma auris TaxID=498019 RepID=A0A2H0ZW12_CANAR|nr:hypothetical_protein [[Candida] auris]KND95600.2 hypothetical protein QG37_08139 [[Candida] auris]PIS52503.1 hypothetical protein CJI97_002148 [[Candida] auris]PIS54819.1 hypothetical protein B9J08_001963 [[Candida] auris]QEO21785.1 hypothetical_protein [[Candida] auris]QWW24415.1 hypothetical protein CA7LBN_003249 [[Candida] auris]
MNEDLINSAVSFLKDPNVASSPLNKKVEFLETKGLNEQEIEEALNRANGTSTSQSNASTPSSSSTLTPSASQPQAPPPVPYDYYGMAPQPPERSWKDYFIMATATAGVTYGLYQVVSRYLIPSIIPPSQSRIDADKETIDEEFMKIDKVLEQMSEEQKEIKEANESKLKEIDVVIDNINDFLSKYNKDKLKFDDDLRLMKLEVDSLKNSVEKNMKLTKDNIQDELGEITEELGSLKNLIKARSEANSTSEHSGPRKVAPVSSIPSASEILKRAKAKSATNANSAATATANTSNTASQPGSGETSSVTSPGQTNAQIKETRPSTPGNIFAAGIPEWQLKHKQAEEEAERKRQEEARGKQEEAKQAEIESESKDESSPSAWQQSALKEGNDDDLVNKSIENVGVPAWQLSAGN